MTLLESSELTRVYILDLGTMELPASAFFWMAGEAEKIRFPVYGTLVVHKEGTFLFDSGFDKQLVDELMPGNAIQSPEQTLEGQLYLIGMRPSDISHVINSHYHIDHVGANKQCTQALTLAHRLELEAAAHPEQFEFGYYDLSFAPGLQESNRVSDYANDIYTPGFETIEGDQEIARGLYLFETPGHTKGHYSLMVELASRRPVLFTGDACYTKKSLEENLISTAHSDVRQSYNSLQRLRDLAEKYDAEIFYGHDPDAFKGWILAPGYYS